MTRQTQQKHMERHYLGTHVWRDSVFGIIRRCSFRDRTVCVEWTGATEPEWITTDVVKRLRAAMTRAKNQQLALRPK